MRASGVDLVHICLGASDLRFEMVSNGPGLALACVLDMVLEWTVHSGLYIVDCTVGYRSLRLP